MVVQNQHEAQEGPTERPRCTDDAGASTQALVSAFQLWIVAGCPDEEAVLRRCFVALKHRAKERMCADLPAAGPDQVEIEVDLLFQGEIEWGPHCPAWLRD